MLFVESVTLPEAGAIHEYQTELPPGFPALFLAQTFLWQEPLVAGAWIGLAIKTDGAAVAGGGITKSLIMAKAAAEGIKYQPGWILATTTTVKIFIDIFIGIWAFILGYIWTNHIDKGPDKASNCAVWG